MISISSVIVSSIFTVFVFIGCRVGDSQGAGDRNQQHP
jgi:hypothetical protein